MRSPESAPQERWNNLSHQRCKAVYDVLAQLEITGSLPEGKTADGQSLEKARDIMDYAERVIANSQFWASLPEEVPTRPEGRSTKKEDLKSRLEGIIQECR